MTHAELSRAAWRTSSYSGANGSCVEVAPVPGAHQAGGQVAVRDSKDRDGPALVFSARQWRAFAARIKDGAFDLI